MKQFLLLCTVLIFISCSKVSDEVVLQAREAVAKGAVIIDVRSAEEFQTGHIHGANNIPLDALALHVKSFDKAKTYVIYCHSGARSSVATNYLKKLGFRVIDVATQTDFERKIVSP